MGIETDVIEAIFYGLETRLNVLRYPIKAPGRTFVPPTNQKYIELVMIPENGADTWGNEKQFAGIIRIILHWKNDDAGIIPPSLVCEAIIAALPKDTTFTYGAARLVISTVPVQMQPLEDGHESLYPVTFRYVSPLIAAT